MTSHSLQIQVAAKWQDTFKNLNRRQPGISGLIEFSQAWSLATEFMRPKNISEPCTSQNYDIDAVKAALDIINKSKRLPALLETFLEELKKNFYLIQREVDMYMLEYQTSLDPNVISKLVFRLADWLQAWAPISELGKGVLQAYTLHFHTNLFSILPPSFAGAFKALCASTLPPAGPRNVIAKPKKASMWFAFDKLGMVERYESLIASVGYEHIEAYVLSTCTGQWAEPMLGGLKEWMANKIVPWMLLAYGRNARNTEEARVMLQGVGSRFDFHMNKTLCDLRTREIFDIIIDFPDSMGALQDLKVENLLLFSISKYLIYHQECLQRVDQRSSLVSALRKAHHKRLLHPGADTKLILSQYVATIKCLRIVDPQGVLLFKVADPIRRYLRQRPDTIRSIVANLVGDDENGDSLVDENEPIQPLQQVDTEDYLDPNWEPEPIDAGPDFRTNKPSDILSTLVSIYDSKDLFVKELQVLLAQRLLAINSDDTEKVEKERRNIEILKIRFGESALQVCEVMLKDMTDSKRIDGHVQSQKASVVHPTIISRHFWPSLDSSDIVMPGQFQVLQEQYSAEFSIFKPDKKLRWLPHLGNVSLQIQLKDRVVDVEVPPLEAAFIELFSQKDVWTMSGLISAVGSVDKNAALKALLTWVDLGVLKEESENTFRLLETSEESSSAPRDAPHRPPPVEPELPPVASIQQQQAEQMKMYWKFIEGMLTNLGSLPLDRIQTMLKFAPGYDQTIDQLAAFMEAARREGLVTGRDGIWRLNR